MNILTNVLLKLLENVVYHLCISRLTLMSLVPTIKYHEPSLYLRTLTIVMNHQPWSMN